MMIAIKNNKGGIGKTFLTTQLGAGLAILEKKVLILTSDSQNNIFNYSLKNNDLEIKKGLKSEVEKGDGDFYKLRKNLEFLPLEDNHFSSQFMKKLPEFLKKIEKKYDFILIDSVPTLKIDSIFLECSNKIIVPTFCDEVTTEGIVNLIENTDINKILAIVINKYKDNKIQKKYKEILISLLENTDIILPTPIQATSFIEQALDKKKTIWEYRNKDAVKVQNSLVEIISNLI